MNKFLLFDKISKSRKNKKKTMKKQIIILFVLIFINIINTCNILSLSGGGAHGAFQGGVLNRLHSQGKKWHVISGVSSGSLNTMMLGIYKDNQQSLGMKLIEKIWKNITRSDVYRWNLDPIYDISLLDNSPLNKTVFNILTKYGAVAKREIIIGAANLNTGLFRLFTKTDLNSVIRTNNIVMASSSIPVIFPPRFFDNQYYVDGGTFSNEIIRPAIQYCLDKGYGIEDISIDVIICSPPIKNITNKEIRKDYIYGLGSRAYDIASNSLSNHEIYTQCNEKQTTIPMNIYKPNLLYPGGLLDFNHKDLVNMYEIGYNTTKYVESKYCF